MRTKRTKLAIRLYFKSFSRVNEKIATITLKMGVTIRTKRPRFIRAIAFNLNRPLNSCLEGKAFISDETGGADAPSTSSIKPSSNIKKERYEPYLRTALIQR